MINRSATSNAFEFVSIAVLRTQQLVRGCIPRVAGAGEHKKTTLAQMEIVAGKVERLPAIVKVVQTEPVPALEYVVAD
jgi:DNA-directed RNA polymerase subunit K/omega